MLAACTTRTDGEEGIDSVDAAQQAYESSLSSLSNTPPAVTYTQKFTTVAGIALGCGNSLDVDLADSFVIMWTPAPGESSSSSKTQDRAAEVGHGNTVRAQARSCGQAGGVAR